MEQGVDYSTTTIPSEQHLATITPLLCSSQHDEEGHDHDLTLSSTLAVAAAAAAMTSTTTTTTTSAAEEQRRQSAAAIDDDGDEPGGGGSSMAGATFNFTNCIVGAGAIALGGAMAQSGGIISIVSILGFAILTKQSLDLVIRLSLETAIMAAAAAAAPPPGGVRGNTSSGAAAASSTLSYSYEDLGEAAFGILGRRVVAASKFLYSFGCLVAYVVVVKDNFAAATHSLFCETKTTTTLRPSPWLFQQLNVNNDNNNDGEKSYYDFTDSNDHPPTPTTTAIDSLPCHILEHANETTWLICIGIILPLCLLRDMRPLASFSAISIAMIVAIVVIILYLYVANPNGAIQHNNHNSHDDGNNNGNTGAAFGGFYEMWMEIRPGYMECLGTFVFAFVSQHTVHLVFASLKPELRTLRHWNRVSFYSVAIAAVLSLTIGMGVYLSFGQEAQSDLFNIYPPLPVIDLAKLLLCVTMILTFPLPFFSCREIIITTLLLRRKPPTVTAVRNPELLLELEAETSAGDPTVSQPTASQPIPSTDRNCHQHHHEGEELQRRQQPVVERRESDDCSDLEQPLLEHYRKKSSYTGIPSSSTVVAAAAAATANSYLLNPLVVVEQPLERTATMASTTISTSSSNLQPQEEVASHPHWWLNEDDPSQLKFHSHVALTCQLWLVVVSLAIAAPSLGDVLDLVGCASGSLIAFIIPACVSFQLQGYTLLATVLLLVGGVVGIVGSFFSIRKLWHDIV